MTRLRERFFSARMLGKWLPLRLLYEAAERSGLLQRVLAKSTGRPAFHCFCSPIAGVPLVSEWSDPAQEADRISKGFIALFGRSIDIGRAPDWHEIGGGDRWQIEPWRAVDLYRDPRRDVKWAWELARQRHLLILAICVSRSGTDPQYAETLNRHLQSWFRWNPPELGVHWYSNLELALRALVWLRVVALVPESLDREIVSEMKRHLAQMGNHLFAVLPLTISSMQNNHLIGDAIGLVAIGKAFGQAGRARLWMRVGDALLEWHLRKHVHLDGSTIEDSLGYRCFVLELLTMRIALGGASREVTEAAERLARHLERLGAGSGSAPHFGDWDGGHVFVGELADQDPSRTLTMFRAVASKDADGVDNESQVSPHLGVESTQSDRATSDGTDTGGELGRLARGPWTTWLKCTAEESHGHSDMLSVSIQHNRQWVISDPGNGSYNRSMEERNYFRTAIAHSVVRVEGQDQRVPHRRFRWRYMPSGKLGKPFDAGPYRVMWGTHDAYRRLKRPQDCMRACLVNDTTFIMVDWVIGEPTDYAMSLPLHPDVQWDGEQVELADGTSIGIALPGRVTSVRGSHEPYDGWWADTYDSVRPATRLEITGTTDQAIVWALFTEAEPSYEVKRDEVSVGNVTFKPERRDDRLVLLSD